MGHGQTSVGGTGDEGGMEEIARGRRLRGPGPAGAAEQHLLQMAGHQYGAGTVAGRTQTRRPDIGGAFVRLLAF